MGESGGRADKGGSCSELYACRDAFMFLSLFIADVWASMLVRLFVLTAVLHVQCMICS